jgi:hypothetical protein
MFDDETEKLATAAYFSGDQPQIRDRAMIFALELLLAEAR